VLVTKVPRQNAYAAYISATYHQTEGASMLEKIKTIAASWRTLDPKEKAEWAVRAQSSGRIRNVYVVPSPGRPNSMNMYVKANMGEVSGTPHDKMRSVGAQWTALPYEEKVAWTEKAAALRAVAIQAAPRRLPTAMNLYVKEKIAEAPAGSPHERMRFVGLQWAALPSDEKAVWIRKAAELRETVIKAAPRAPKRRSGYHVFLRDRLLALGGKMSVVAAEWKAAGPDVKERYNRRAAEMNSPVGASPQQSNTPTTGYQLFCLREGPSILRQAWKALPKDTQLQYRESVLQSRRAQPHTGI